MEGNGKTLFWFSEKNVELEVPFFQRSYVWDEENWKSLYNGIKNADKARMPFVGSLILQCKENKNYWIIDGQQRITTFTIIIKSILDSGRKLSPQARTTFESLIYKTVVLDIENTEYIPRLTASHVDEDEYNLLMKQNLNSTELSNKNSKLINCYNFFTNIFGNFSDEEFSSFASKLLTSDNYLITIELNEKDDEQEIFDTVNSLGKGLTGSDIVKNYMYQKMKNYAGNNSATIKKVLQHYKDYWEKIFLLNERREFWDKNINLGRIATTNLDAFLKDFATIKKIYVPSATGGYESISKQYKNYINKLNLEQLFDFSIELSKYAEIFYTIWTNYESCNDFRINDILNLLILTIDKLEISTFNPYILYLLSTNDKDKDAKIFSLEKFILKRFLWKASTKNYNKICANLIDSSTPIEYLENYNEQTIDVNWNEYPSGLKTIKNVPANLILFIIEMIRRNIRGEDFYSDTLTFNKTLEHVMPQKWHKKWENVQCFSLNADGAFDLILDDDEKEKIRKLKIYSIGNMTLLSAKLNTSVSNDTFENKINGKKGIKSFVGSISIAQEIVDIYNRDNCWDERNIYSRELSLFKELNNYFNFSKFSNNTSYLQSVDNFNITAEYFTDEWFEKTKIGELIRESFIYMFKNNLLNAEEINNLMDSQYSDNTFKCKYPVLVNNETKTFDSFGRKRYWVKSFEINNAIYFVCKEWYESNRKYIVPWLKNKLKKQ